MHLGEICCILNSQHIQSLALTNAAIRSWLPWARFPKKRRPPHNRLISLRLQDCALDIEQLAMITRRSYPFLDELRISHDSHIGSSRCEDGPERDPEENLVSWAMVTQRLLKGNRELSIEPLELTSQWTTSVLRDGCPVHLQGAAGEQMKHLRYITIDEGVEITGAYRDDLSTRSVSLRRQPDVDVSDDEPGTTTG